MATSYSLSFNGYWLGPGGLPANSGIYCVYACRHNNRANTVLHRKLLYIGEAANIRNRVCGHERQQDWERKLQRGEVLCFSAARIAPEADRQRAEAATIHQHKPPCNAEYVHSFPYGQTTISTGGCNALLDSRFTVYPTTGQDIEALLGGAIPRW